MTAMMNSQAHLIQADIQAYLAQHERKELLRFLTCGSVDDGKSTLIGRLLHDSKMIYEDQLAAVRKDSVKLGTTGGDLDLALLVDGLQAEREQGITIDVAYRYFSTARRKYIIADTPGHEQYTRNMATGASNCDLAVILIDARHGVQTQTRRHSFIVALLGIRHVVVAINKMDLVDYSEAVFGAIQRDYLAFAQSLKIPDLRFVPLSALKGDNVVDRSPEMPWFQGQPLLELLDTIEISRDRSFGGFRFPVQYVNRPHLDFRGYSGTIAAGAVKPGDPVTCLPSGTKSRVKRIVAFDGDLTEAFTPQAVTLTLEDEIDISRGDMLVGEGHPPLVDSRFVAHVVWMTEAPLTPGKSYLIKHTTRTVTAAVARILDRIDVNTLERHPAQQLRLNEIGLCEIATGGPIVFDPYAECHDTGALIFIDRLSNVTVGAGMIVGKAERRDLQKVTPQERAARFGHRALTLWIQGSDAISAAEHLERRLFDRGYACTLIDPSLPLDTALLITENLNLAGLVAIAVAPPTGPGRQDEVHHALSSDRIDIDAIVRLLSPLPTPLEDESDFVI